jgi:hypothetical protein
MGLHHGPLHRRMACGGRISSSQTNRCSSLILDGLPFQPDRSARRNLRHPYRPRLLLPPPFLPSLPPSQPLASLPPPFHPPRLAAITISFVREIICSASVSSTASVIGKLRVSIKSQIQGLFIQASDCAFPSLDGCSWRPACRRNCMRGNLQKPQVSARSPVRIKRLSALICIQGKNGERWMY